MQAHGRLLPLRHTLHSLASASSPHHVSTHTSPHGFLYTIILTLDAFAGFFDATLIYSEMGCIKRHQFASINTLTAVASNTDQ